MIGLQIEQFNKTGLQLVSRLVEQVPLFEGWGLGARCQDRQKDRRPDRQTDGQTDRQTARQTDRRPDRQTGIFALS